MRLLKWFRQPHTHELIYGKAEGASQTLVLEKAVLEHVEKFRQLNAVHPEAGGQLFGYLNENEIRVTAASGPYGQDQRGRYHYRSNNYSAQKAIENFAKKGLYYLGEWHTHAEDFPSASASDIDAMNKLLGHSTLNVSGLLMLIVGRSSLLSGYSVTMFHQAARFSFELSHDQQQK
jgi:integrative and conjugative element protein (TIGR02256 family)